MLLRFPYTVIMTQMNNYKTHRIKVNRNLFMEHHNAGIDIDKQKEYASNYKTKICSYFYNKIRVLEKFIGYKTSQYATK